MDKFLDLNIDTITKNKVPKIISTSALDILDEYMTINTHLISRIEGRYKIED